VFYLVAGTTITYQLYKNENIKIKVEELDFLINLLIKILYKIIAKH
jgi:hypothetical protein